MDTQLTTKSHRIDPLELIRRSARLSEATKARYSKSLSNYLATGASLENAAALADYAASLPMSTRAHLSAAVTHYVKAMQHEINSTVTPDNLAGHLAASMRYQALGETVKVERPKGSKTHTWLSQAQVRKLFQNIPAGIVGDRDRVLLGLLVAAGLRRDEAVNLTFDDIVLQPVGDRFRSVLNVKGKGSKTRQVPISDKLAEAMLKWGNRIGNRGRVLRSLGMNREPGASMSAVAVFKVIRAYGVKIGKPDLAAHDLRRTFAQLGHAAGVPITQLSRLLGHESIETTQRYLNLELDLTTTASDFIPMN